MFEWKRTTGVILKQGLCVMLHSVKHFLTLFFSTPGGPYYHSGRPRAHICRAANNGIVSVAFIHYIYKTFVTYESLPECLENRGGTFLVR